MPTSSEKARVTHVALAVCVAVLLAVAALTALPALALADDDTLPAPATVKAEATEKCTVKVGWSKVPDAMGYMIYSSKQKDEGFAAVDYVPFYRTSYTDTAATAGTKLYYKVATMATDGSEGVLSKAAAVKVGATFKNSFVKFTIPKYWRGKVYVEEKTTRTPCVSILDSKTGLPVTTIDWFRKANDMGGDAVNHSVKILKRGKGTVEIWVNSWATSLYYSKYYYDRGNPTVHSDGYESERQLTNAETNRLIQLQTGGKLNYAKVKKVPESKVSKYWRVSDKYIAKNLKVKVVTASTNVSASAEPAFAKSANTKACKAYKEFLSKKTMKWGNSAINPRTLRFACQDINKDGVKDLVLYRKDSFTAEGYFQIYTYAKGKLKRIGTYQSVRVYRNKNFFISDTERMGYGHFTYYRLGKNGKVKKLASFDYLMMEEPKSYDKVVVRDGIPFYYYGCKVNGKRVSYETCMAEVKSLKKGAKSTLKYHKNTAANRAKYTR